MVKPKIHFAIKVHIKSLYICVTIFFECSDYFSMQKIKFVFVQMYQKTITCLSLIIIIIISCKKKIGHIWHVNREQPNNFMNNYEPVMFRLKQSGT